jgi:hypothetical protein
VAKTTKARQKFLPHAPSYQTVYGAWKPESWPRNVKSLPNRSSRSYGNRGQRPVSGQFRRCRRRQKRLIVRGFPTGFAGLIPSPAPGPRSGDSGLPRPLTRPPPQTACLEQSCKIGNWAGRARARNGEPVPAPTTSPKGGPLKHGWGNLCRMMRLQQFRSIIPDVADPPARRQVSESPAHPDHLCSGRLLASGLS